MPRHVEPDHDDAGSAADRRAARRWIDLAAHELEHGPPSSRDLHLPRVPGYEVIRRVGGGGQGTVYEAIHLATRRRVAIKALTEALAGSDAARARFDRELLLANRVDHPSVVAVLDRIEVDGRVHHVMEFVDGLPFDEFVSLHRPGLDATLELMARVCDAVAAAHVRGVIHRDLKPGNVLVDASGAPHVVDFGLAKIQERSAASAARCATLTRTGQFLGSLAWTSPEQAEGRTDEIDVRSDVYSLGVMLHHALTGAFPYRVDGALRETLEHIARTPPSSPRRFVPGIDRDVETIVLTCLQKDPGRRYQSAGDLARDLRRRIAGLPIAARGDSTLYTVGKLVSRHRVAVAGGLVAAAMLVAAVVTLAALQIGKQREATRANTLLAIMVDDIFGKVGAVGDEGRDPRMSNVLHAAASSIDAKTYDPLVEQFARRVLAMGFRSIGLLEDATVQIDRASALCDRHLHEGHPDALAIQLERGRILLRSGDEAELVGDSAAAAQRWTLAGEVLDQVDARAASTLGRNAPLRLDVREERAQAMRRTGGLDEAIVELRSIEAARRAAAAVGGAEELSAIETLAGLADALERRWQSTADPWDIAEAVQCCREVLRRLEARSQPDVVRIATARSALADKLGRTEPNASRDAEISRLRAEAKEGFAAFTDPEAVMMRRIHDSLVRYLERSEGGSSAGTPSGSPAPQQGPAAPRSARE